MHRRVVVVFRRPEKIQRAIATARQLIDDGARPLVVFLCPGCDSRTACRSVSGPGGDKGPLCLTDQCEDCVPQGVCHADEGRIADLLRKSDFVLPV